MSYHVVVFLVLLVASSLPCQTLAQAAADIGNIIGRDLATYILIGVAGLFVTITVLCFCLILCTCYYNHKRVREKRRKSIYKDVDFALEDVIKNVHTTGKEAEKDTAFAETNKEPSSSSSEEEEDLSDDDGQRILKHQQLNAPEKETPRLSPIRRISNVRSHSPMAKRRSKEQGKGASPLRQSQASMNEHQATVAHDLAAHANQVAQAPIRKRSNVRNHAPRLQTSVASFQEQDGWVRKNPGYLASRLTSRPISALLVQQELSSASHKWLSIGVHLKVPMKTLENIKMIHGSDHEKCLMMVAEEWIHTEKYPSWLTVVGVLQRRIISEEDLATDIRQRYCKSPTTTDEEGDSLSEDIGEELDTSVTLVS